MALLSSLYNLLLSGRKLLYSTIKKPEGLPARVISVGNLTLGGTGKTPATIAIAREARRRGLNPCILTRGYRGRGKGPCLVTMGDKPLIGPSEAGDEAYLMAERLKGIPIIKGANRYKSGLLAIETLKSRITDYGSRIILILDDGFQHWRLKRDVDIVLIDSSCYLKDQHLLPEGRLREPLSALERADIIVLTKIEDAEDRLISDNIELIRKYNPSSPVYRAYFRPSGLIDMKGNIEDTDRLKGNRVYAFAGIASPSHFRSMLISLGADVTGFKNFRDHHAYTEKDLREIEKDAKGIDIITTEKDMVKLKGTTGLDKLYALKIEFIIEQDFYDLIFN